MNEGKVQPFIVVVVAVFLFCSVRGQKSCVHNKSCKVTSAFSFCFQEEFRRLYTQLETLKHRNMKIGNRHLQHKLSAMTEAAQKEDSPEESNPCTPNMNGKRVIINLDDFKESTTL